MSFTYNLLHGSNTRLKGQLAEEIAAFYARKFYNLTVYRPKQLLRECGKINLDSSTIFKFIEENQQTMDFLGIWPRNIEYEIDRNSKIFQIFGGVVLDPFISEKSIPKSKGWIIEVKSGISRNSISQTSTRQDKMIKTGLELGLGVMLPQIAFERNWQMRIRFYDENGCILKPEPFQLSKSELIIHQESEGNQ